VKRDVSLKDGSAVSGRGSRKLDHQLAIAEEEGEWPDLRIMRRKWDLSIMTSPRIVRGEFRSYG